MRPLLTIAIPTCNRSEHLKKTLDSIVIQNVFIDSDDVEIVVSDNCSSDNTMDVCRDYLTRYNGKFFYHRNNENTLDRNFEIVLKLSNGHYLKLNNDTLTHQETSLEKMLSTIRSYQTAKNVIFWGNGNLKVHNVTVNNLDEFVKHISYWSTWIGSFGIWREDFLKIIEFDRYSKLQLIQTDVLYRQIADGKKVFINNDTLFQTIDLEKKGGYDILSVFLENYSHMLKEYVPHVIELRTYNDEMRTVLMKFISEWLTNIRVHPRKFTFESKGAFKRIDEFYEDQRLLLLMFYLKYYILLTLKFIKKRILKLSR